MNINKLKKMIEFDEIVGKEANGIFTAPSEGSTDNFDLRGLIKYCKNNDIDISNVTDEEIEMFTNDKNDYKVANTKDVSKAIK